MFAAPVGPPLVIAVRRQHLVGVLGTEFDLFGHPANTGGCLPTGGYRFFDTLYANDREDANDTEWQYQWRFILVVERT